MSFLKLIEKNKDPIVYIFGAVLVIFFIWLISRFCNKNSGTGTRENYRDPIFMNRYKLMYDYYPRSNGSIYGMPLKYGGNWHLFSGYPLYDKAY